MPTSHTSGSHQTAQKTLSFEAEHKSRVLTSGVIKELVVDSGLITPNTFSERSLNFCSYDVRVGSRIVFSGSGEIRELKENDTFQIAPGAYAGVISREEFNFPLNVFGSLGTKRRFSYEGLILLTGSVIDPGYQGHLLFTIYNASNKPAFLQFEDNICTLTFTQLEHAATQHFHDPSLIEGKFPSDFVRHIGQTDPSGYMHLKEEVERIHGLSERLGRLEAEYNDVRGPIKDLTKLVEGVTKDLQTVQSISRENTGNIKELIDSSKKLGETVASHKVELSWLKWGTTSVLGGLLVYWILNKLLPMLHGGGPGP